MGYFQVRYDSRVINYDHRGFLRLTTGDNMTREGSNYVRPSMPWSETTVFLDRFCLKRTRLVVKWRHLVVTFSIKEFSSISQIKCFLLQCSD